MNYINYKFGNFNLELKAPIGLIYVKHSTEIEITWECDGLKSERIYTLDGRITAVEFEGEYVRMYYKDSNSTGTKWYQLKFEGESGIVIDSFDTDDEWVDSIGCWDFYDD